MMSTWHKHRVIYRCVCSLKEGSVWALPSQWPTTQKPYLLSAVGRWDYSPYRESKSTQSILRASKSHTALNCCFLNQILCYTTIHSHFPLQNKNYGNLFFQLPQLNGLALSLWQLIRPEGFYKVNYPRISTNTYFYQLMSSRDILHYRLQRYAHNVPIIKKIIHLYLISFIKPVYLAIPRTTRTSTKQR